MKIENVDRTKLEIPLSGEDSTATKCGIAKYLNTRDYYVLHAYRHTSYGVLAARKLISSV